MNRIKFLRPGLYTSIQDMKRIGYKKYGIPNSGPMDEYSHILSNWLVDNSYSSETLEINYFGPKLKFNFDTTIGICGANFDAKINDKRIQINRKPMLSLKLFFHYYKIISHCLIKYLSCLNFNFRIAS